MKPAATVVRQTREAAGLTQVELARATGTTQAMISRYENGKTTPSKRAMARILGACSAGRPRPHEVLLAHRSEVIEVLRKYGADQVLVFGSVARGEDDETSDIDLLVDHFDEDAYSWGQPKAQDDLEKLLGVKVDVGELDNMRRPVLIEALKEARAL
jgi:predicted nucleotidyltransferase/DNA-binding XRE family transcriptional regulator